MTALPPAVLDTLSFAPAPPEVIEAAALADRAGLRLVDVPGARLRARVVGDGRATVVCLPDGPNTIEHYDELAAGLVADGHRVVLLEIPGFGYSWASAPEVLTFAGTVTATARALAELAPGPGPVLLSGVCVQAHVALGVAALRSRSVDALLLVQAASWADTQHWGGEVLDPAGELRTPWSGQAGWRLHREALAVDGWYALAAGPGAPVDEWRHRARAVLRGPSSYALATLLQAWSAVAEPDLRPPDELPATVVWGEADRTHRRAGSDPRGLLAHVPHARHVTWPEAGHFADVEAPDAFRAEVAALLARLA